MSEEYQKHTKSDRRFLARKRRGAQVKVLMPLLCVLCFLIGVCLLATGVLLFSFRTVPMRWLQFSILYLFAGVLFLFATLWSRNRDRVPQRRH